MSKLNRTPARIKTPAPYGLSLSGNGNLQANKSPEFVLFETLVSTLYGSESMYEKTDDKVARMRGALVSVVGRHGQAGAEYALRVAKFAREKMNIRTMPIVMLVELAKVLRDSSIQVDGMRAGVAAVINRADELTDLYAYALTVFGSKKEVPLSLKKGVGDAFNKFDAYQFGKYNRSEGLKFKDLLRIVHPKPADIVRAEIFNKIMSESLEAPYTWEVELSKNGQLGAEQKTKKQIWTELITREGSGSLGYMALLRNLRNMKEAGISNDTWRLVASRISDPKQVEKSKQLPFGFINAYEIAKQEGLPQLILDALTDATEQSLSNMPKLGDRVWIILDCSGSMGVGTNHFTSVQQNTPIKIGAIFASALYKAAKGSFNVTLTMFDDHAKDVALNPRDSIFTNFERVMARNAGGGTNLQSALDRKKTLGYEPDTVIVLSDMEVNRLDGHNSPNIFRHDCVKVAVNLNSRGNTPIGEHAGWIQLSGWSERIFQYVNFKRDTETIVQKLWKGDVE